MSSANLIRLRVHSSRPCSVPPARRGLLCARSRQHAGERRRSLDVSCWICHHRAIMSAEPWPDSIPVPSFGRRMVCTKCGIVGADVRPNWRERERGMRRCRVGGVLRRGGLNGPEPHYIADLIPSRLRHTLTNIVSHHLPYGVKSPRAFNTATVSLSVMLAVPSSTARNS